MIMISTSLAIMELMCSRQLPCAFRSRQQHTACWCNRCIVSALWVPASVLGLPSPGGSFPITTVSPLCLREIARQHLPLTPVISPMLVFTVPTECLKGINTYFTLK